MSDNPDPKEFIGQYKQDIVAYVDALVEQDHRERYGKSRHLHEQMTANQFPTLMKGISCLILRHTPTIRYPSSRRTS